VCSNDITPLCLLQNKRDKNDKKMDLKFFTSLLPISK